METTFFNFSSKLENKEEVYNTALISLILSSVFFSLLFLIFAGSIADGLSTPNSIYLPQFIIWSVLIVASDAITAIPFAKLRLENKALKFSVLKLSNVVINFGLTIFFLKICKSSYDNGETNFMASLYNPEIGIGYAFLANLLANCFTLILLSKQFAGLKFSLNIELLKKMLLYAWPLIILGLAGMINETLDRIILKKLIIDKSEAQIAQGVYGACYKIAILMTIFIQAFRFAAEPFFFNKAKEKDSTKSYALVMKYFVIFCLFLFLATTLNLDWIKLFIGPNFRSGLNVVPILLMANLCLGVVYNLAIWYKLNGQTKYGAIIAIVGAIITIVVNVIFVPHYSYVASAWATLAAYSGMMVLSYILGQKYFPIKYNIKAITVYTLIALGFYFISLTYNGMENVILKVILNNLFVAFFVFILYKLEFSNITKLTKNVSTHNN
jgi:O-antigen/teichoic acid export membrane protein